jgi:hypothetical protein
MIILNKLYRRKSAHIVKVLRGELLIIEEAIGTNAFVLAGKYPWR